jgi:hypothetical protein
MSKNEKTPAELLAEGEIVDLSHPFGFYNNSNSITWHRSHAMNRFTVESKNLSYKGWSNVVFDSTGEVLKTKR